MDELTLLRNIAQAAQMTRDRQRKYFQARREHNHAAATNMLQLSKSAEAHLDKLLAEYQSGHHTDQDDLFAAPPRPP